MPKTLENFKLPDSIRERLRLHKEARSTGWKKVTKTQLVCEALDAYLPSLARLRRSCLKL